MKKKIASILVSIIAAAVVFTGCGSISNETKTKFSDQYYDVFDTAVSVTVYCSDRKIFDSVNGTIHEMLQIYHQLFDIYNEYDGVVNIKTLNDKAAQGPVEVSADITEFLSFAGTVQGDSLSAGRLYDKIDKKASAKAKAEMLGLMVNDPNVKPEELAAIQAKTLVMAGTHDLIKEAHTRLIASKIPDAELVLIEGNHFIASKKTNEFNQAVLAFLQS